jgi:hypothetical protein
LCQKNADQLGSLAGLSVPKVCVGVVDCSPASLSSASSSLTHTRWMNGCSNQNADQLGCIFPMYVCRSSRLRARPPLHLLLHTQVSGHGGGRDIGPENEREKRGGCSSPPEGAGSTPLVGLMGTTGDENRLAPAPASGVG